jgi:heptosyltransferase-2
LINEVSGRISIYLMGSESERTLIDQRFPSRPGLTNLAGKLTLLESAALMKQAVMNFTNDSAPLHLASAVNAPVTAVFCSTVPEFGFGPLSDDSAVVQHPGKLACRPCGIHGKKECPEKHMKCGYDIPVSELSKRITYER